MELFDKATCNILIVDDISKNIQVLGGILRREGYALSYAVSGEQALKMAFADGADLVLLDVMMPQMDGFEVCRRLKANPRTREIPIIFLTAKTEKEDIVKGFELGAVDYVTKPFNTPELLARVHTHLALKIYNAMVRQTNKKLMEKNDRLKQLNIQLQQALKEIKTLKGMLPICSSCKKIRKKDADPEKKESWVDFESYMRAHTEASFTHSICPECMHKLYPGLMDKT